MDASHVDPRFAQHFARRIVLAARAVETAEDRKRRDALWLTERRRLWEPLFVLAWLVRFPLRVAKALQTGAEAGVWVFGFVLAIHFMATVSIGSSLESVCQSTPYAQRERDDIYIYRLSLYLYRIWAWLAWGRTDIQGCWAHPDAEHPTRNPPQRAMDWLSDRLEEMLTPSGLLIKSVR